LPGFRSRTRRFPATASYPFDLAVERIRAAAAAARALPRDFVLVARADGVMTGAYDLEEALRRVRAFDAAGADCLYVPVPGTLADLARVVAATDKPVNALAAGPFAEVRGAEFARLGVARISLGSALARVTHRAIVDAGRAALAGDFSPLSHGIAGAEVDRLLKT
jgi:2-methylisocitrate lyase-like PEP mutase family enzyme